jgi:trypsin inhibitor
MPIRTHLTWLSAALLACGSAADLGTPYTPDASSGGSAGAAGGDASQVMCLYGGGSYPVGATFPAGDGCNSCTCFAPGDVRCTRCACIKTDAGPLGCGSGGTPDAAPDGATTSVCSLPFDSGPCDAAIRVFAYVGGACIEQIYGGCLGNGNRFDSIRFDRRVHGHVRWTAESARMFGGSFCQDDLPCVRTGGRMRPPGRSVRAVMWRRHGLRVPSIPMLGRRVPGRRLHLPHSVARFTDESRNCKLCR